MMPPWVDVVVVVDVAIRYCPLSSLLQISRRRLMRLGRYGPTVAIYVSYDRRRRVRDVTPRDVIIR